MTIQTEDQKEFVAQLAMHEPIAHKFCNFYFKNKEERLDVLQAIRESAWKSFHKFRHECKFTTWFYAITRNTVMSIMRKKKSAPIVFYYGRMIDVPDESAAITQRMKEEVIEFDRLISTLTEGDQTMISLYILGESQERIATLMDMEIGTVRVRLHRVKKTMRKNCRINII